MKVRQSVAAFLLGLMLASGIPFLFAIDAPETGTEWTTPYGRWTTIGDFTSGNTALDLSVNERTYRLVTAAIAADVSGDGNIVLGQLDYGVSVLRYRLVGGTNNAVNTFYLYTGAKGDHNDCDLVPRAVLSFTVGLQLSSENNMFLADTLVVSNTTATTKNWITVSPANDTCSETFIDLQGDDIYCLVPTVLGSDCQVIVKDF